MPTGRPVTITLKRSGEQITAAINGEELAPEEKHYGGDPKASGHLAITIKRGQTVLLRDIKLYVEEDEGRMEIVP